MANQVVIDPATRLEGHWKFEATLQTDAGLPNYPNDGIIDPSATPKGYKIAGTMWRGFELIMLERDPRDAIVICSRI